MLPVWFPQPAAVMLGSGEHDSGQDTCEGRAVGSQPCVVGSLMGNTEEPFGGRGICETLELASRERTAVATLFSQLNSSISAA